jgi:hypothetical protein
MTTNVTAQKVPKLPLGKVTFNVNREMSLANENQRDDPVTVDGDVKTGVGSRQCLLNADLLTLAFSIPSFQTVDEIEDSCASMLGVKGDRLRIYSLTPLKIDSSLSTARGAQRIAIEVENSCESVDADKGMEFS